ncbi:MAG: hypothetical protein EOO68_22650, partial [Moraxellaceae bacterium]
MPDFTSQAAVRTPDFKALDSKKPNCKKSDFIKLEFRKSDARSLYDQNGYLVLTQVFDPLAIEALKAQVAPIYRQWQQQNQHETGYAQQVNMHSLTHPAYFAQPEARMEFFQHLAHPRLVQTLRTTFGSGIYFHNTQLFFNPADPNKTNYWHRDLQYSALSDALQQHIHSELLSLHVRIALIDETGMELIPHSHRQWDSPLEHAVRFARDGHQQHDDLPHSQLIALKAG